MQVVVKDGRTPLHLACNREAAIVGRYPVCQFPLPQLVKALLLVGANPNALDDEVRYIICEEYF
jgi:ankyrin repeat protein